MTYDQSCYDLGKSFLEDSKAPASDIPTLAHDLAQDIQKAIEDFLEEHGL